MKKWLLLAALVVLALLGYVAAGPYLTMRAIRGALQQQDAEALARQVDFPALRTSLQAQLIDAMVRKAGPELQASTLGAFALTLGTAVVNNAVETMVTPTGLAGVINGRRVWNDTVDDFQRPAVTPDGEPIAAPAPLRDAAYRYESPSRFTATVRTETGDPVVLVLHRDGLRWRLADIRLPLGSQPPPSE